MNIKNLSYIFLCLVLFSACGGSEQHYIEETKVVPTEGLITTVVEKEKDMFKISDEQTVKDTADSRIIAKYLDNTIDTFTLEQARLIQANPQAYGHTSGSSGFVTAASYGLMGYMMGRYMMGGGMRPPVSAYTDPKAHQRSAKGAGASMQKTAARTTTRKPAPSGRKGFGGSSSGRSTRSYGG